MSASEDHGIGRWAPAGWLRRISTNFDWRSWYIRLSASRLHFWFKIIRSDINLMLVLLKKTRMALSSRLKIRNRRGKYICSAATLRICRTSLWDLGLAHSSRPSKMMTLGISCGWTPLSTISLRGHASSASIWASRGPEKMICLSQWP